MSENQSETFRVRLERKRAPAPPPQQAGQWVPRLGETVRVKSISSCSEIPHGLLALTGTVLETPDRADERFGIEIDDVRWYVHPCDLEPAEPAPQSPAPGAPGAPLDSGAEKPREAKGEFLQASDSPGAGDFDGHAKDGYGPARGIPIAAAPVTRADRVRAGLEPDPYARHAEPLPDMQRIKVRVRNEAAAKRNQAALAFERPAPKRRSRFDGREGIDTGYVFSSPSWESE